MEQSVLFGRYRLLEPAGKGGTAEVWHARDERTNEEVAVKRLHPIVFARESGRRRLVREFRALRSLRHPNIVRVRDLEVGRDDAAIVLDYVHGPSLADRLADGGPMPVDEAVGIAADVGAALGAAHAAGIVHRDVTPGNVLLDVGGQARLTDFGIARAEPDETAVTATGLLVGTLRYLAPEQLRGRDPTPAADLYSLAAITYEMLAGQPPFAAATPIELVEAQAAEPEPIAGIPAALDLAVRRGLAVDPASRPPSVAAFVGELQEAAAARVSARPGARAQESRPDRRPRSRTLSGGQVVGDTRGMTAAGAMLGQVAAPAHEPSDPEAPLGRNVPGTHGPGTGEGPAARDDVTTVHPEPAAAGSPNAISRRRAVGRLPAGPLAAVAAGALALGGLLLLGSGQPDRPSAGAVGAGSPTASPSEGPTATSTQAPTARPNPPAGGGDAGAGKGKSKHHDKGGHKGKGG